VEGTVALTRTVPGKSPLLLGSPAMRGVGEIIREVADSDATVLILGESGVGKDVVARSIVASSRRREPFVKVNCAALPRELLESELFGHEKGAFTGAFRRKLGKFEFAQHGSLFLDEVGELPLALQAKLLHVLQDREFCRVGGSDPIRADARVIASTNRDLERAIGEGEFREDLYYRLNVVEIHVPPLRRRKEEIPALVRHFLEKFSRDGRPVTLSSDDLDAMLAHDWPGNVRELENVVRRLVLLQNVPEARGRVLAALRSPCPGLAPPPAGPPPAPALAPPLGLREIARQAAAEAERKALREVLERVRWNRTRAAEALKINYKTLRGKIAEYRLDADRPET
jgi:transcriptional regulator with GAF, ATPase, and Fis domain